ncbi:MAG: SAM-dependent methyltransferase [Candidatus Cloacimonetes bacterium]|nr:SAM-dependent methyltransferase [Candidatus Cloacimonadota bacterium]
MLKKKSLYVVAVPIGNLRDFTFRAVEILRNADLVIGEEKSTTERILKNIETLIYSTNDEPKIKKPEIVILNEHNELDKAFEVMKYVVENNFSAALISEAGTPCIADPGVLLVELFHQNNLPVIPIPGVSSLTTALMVSGKIDLIKESNFDNLKTSSNKDKEYWKRHKNTLKPDFEQGIFKYVGFLSQKRETRQNELKILNKEKIPLVILETPYRMKQLLKDIYDICGSNKRLVFTYKLTQADEMIIKSNITEVIKRTENLNKGEFLIILLP